MSQFADILDLATLDLQPGEGRTIEARVRVPSFDLGGQQYALEGGALDASVDVSRTLSAGWALRLRAQAPLQGCCMRCLEPADRLLAVDAYEVEQPGEGEELHSPYLEDERLDLAAWTHDALMLALPAQIVCSEHCRGLCAVCGANLNREAPEDHRHERGVDPRWAKLKEWKPAE